MSKRHKYIIDYLNTQNISSGLIQTRTSNDPFDNPLSGDYGSAKYINSSYLWQKGLIGKIKYFIEINKFILKQYDKRKFNILVFSTLVYVDLLPFYVLAKIKGYDVVFDIVENYNVTGHDSSIFSKISSWLSRQLYKKSLCIFVISNPLKSFVTNIVSKVPVHILPNSAPIKNYNNKNKFSSPIRILYSGTFAPKDGLEYLIKAYIKFSEQTIIKTELILTGAGAKKDVDMILNMIKDFEVIKYMGFVDEEDLEKIINSSDILTMTRCNSEFANFGFPFKLSEYLASGNTVLATKVGDVPLYLKHKENAYLVEPESIDGIVEAFSYLTRTEENAIRIGKNGLNVVNEKFDVNLNGEKFIKNLVNSLKRKYNHKN